MAERKFEKNYFNVLGLCCSSEVPLVENILKALDGIKEVTVVVPSRTVIVVHDSLVISQAQIVKALNQAGLEASMKVNGDEKQQKKWPSPYAIGCGILLLLSLLKFVYRPLEYLALGAVAAGAFPIVLKAIASIRNLRLDINILSIIAVIGTIALNDYLEAGTIVFLFSIAEWLESMASHKASAAMSSLMNITPQKAMIAETREVVDADEVKVNTIVAVKAGEVIPIDGIVVEGNCEVDEKTLTGESFPVPKQKDSTVWAGTINLNGYVAVKTTALSEDCVVAKMAKLVEEAQNSKTRTQTLIEKFAKFYTPAVVVISALLAVIPVALRVHNQKHWLHFALVVLVSACPCALILSTPVATFCAYTKAATSGLLIKGGGCLETLAKIKVMAFDKTGTITKGEFVVTNFQPLSEDIDLKTLLYWVTSIESKSSHPMAAAIVDYGRSHSIEPKPEKVTEFENFPGEGIHGKIDDRDIYIGNRKIVIRTGSETVPALQGDTLVGKTTGYIYSGATPIGFFSLSDACRSGAQQAIGKLKLLGIKTSMLTGDSQAAAIQAQEQLGHVLELVHAELLPEDKVKIITEFKKEGPTAMVGDGVNDAPALATADIGISMGISGSALASETGNIILMSNDLMKIPQAIKLARKSHRKVVENIFLSVLTKAAIIGLALAGHPLVWAAVLADVGTCLLVILNSMLLLHRGHNHKGKCCKSSTQLHVHTNGSCNASHHHHGHHHHHHNHEDQHHSPSNSSFCEHAKITESHVQCKDKANEGKCCKSSTQPHVHTNGSCNATHDKSSHHHHHKHEDQHHHHQHDQKHEDQHHIHHHCCSDKTEEMSQPQKCASKCQSSPSNSSFCAHAKITESHVQSKGKANASHEPKHCHPAGRCEKSLEDGVHLHDTKTQEKCASSIISGSNCLQHHKSHETLHCHNRRCDMETHSKENKPSLSSPCHLNHALPKDFHLTPGCENHKSLNIQHQNPREHQEDHHVCANLEVKEKGSCCEGCSEDCENEREDCELCCSSEKCSKESTETSIVQACISLEKRENGACCKSYMKECCSSSKHGGHLGGGLGGLSEIIITE